MNDLFSICAPDFIPFTMGHFVPVIVMVTVAFLLFIFRCRLCEIPAFKKTVSIVMPAITLLFFLTNLIWLLVNGMFDLRY